MTGFQRVIKYFALAFAIFLIVTIVSFFASIFGIFSYFGEEEEVEQISDGYHSLYEESYDAVYELEIDLEACSLVIQEGERWDVESNSNYVTVKQVGKKMLIKEKGGKVNKRSRELILTIPSNFEFTNFHVDAAFGNVEIDSVIAQRMSLDIGAGKLVIDNLEVKDKLELDGGAGSVEIMAGTIRNLDLEMGVGSVTISTSLLGKNKIEAGVGEIHLNLQDSINNYKFEVEKGIGNIKINENEVKDETIIGTGSTFVEIEGGVGSIQIKTND